MKWTSTLQEHCSLQQLRKAKVDQLEEMQFGKYIAQQW